MTGMLRSVLREHADTTPTPQVDLDRIIGAGERRVRRDRLTTGLAVAAVGAVITGSALALPGLVNQPDDQTADAPSRFTERRVGYAVRDVIRWGGDSFSVGASVASYVQTDDGFVYTTRNGTVWLYDGTDSERIGHAEGNHLRADDSGSLVAWVDLAEDKHPQYVVFDTHAMTEVARVDDNAAGPSLDPGDSGAEVFAVDDGSVYWRTAEGMVRYDVARARTELLSASTPPADPARKDPVAYGIRDVAHGRIAFLVDASRGTELKVAARIDLGAPTLAVATSGFLSPDGRYLGAEENDNIAVYDTTTGADVTPPLSRYPFAVVTGWADHDTAAVFAIKRLDDDTAYPFDVLSCDVPSGDCTVVGQGTAPVNPESLVIPTGDPMT